MKSTAIATIFLTLFFNLASAADTALETTGPEPAEDEVEILPNKKDGGASAPTRDVANFCFFAGTPPPNEKYTVIRTLKVGKGTYGAVKDILPKLVDDARKIGANAIIHYTGSQRFGFFPWRIVRSAAPP